MSIEEYMINQIRENLHWLVKHTDVAWDIVMAPREPEVYGIRFQDSVSTISTIWEDEA